MFIYLQECSYDCLWSWYDEWWSLRTATLLSLVSRTLAPSFEFLTQDCFHWLHVLYLGFRIFFFWFWMICHRNAKNRSFVTPAGWTAICGKIELTIEHLRLLSSVLCNLTSRRSSYNSYPSSSTIPIDQCHPSNARQTYSETRRRILTAHSVSKLVSLFYLILTYTYYQRGKRYFYPSLPCLTSWISRYRIVDSPGMLLNAKIIVIILIALESYNL
jgi:hypothetical protein